jgi:hypothetical protein
MGTCQSLPEPAVDSDVIKDKHFRFVQSVQSPTGAGGGKHKSFSYDFALVSPSERTEKTAALSPPSVFSPLLSNQPNKEENYWHVHVGVGDGNDSFPSDEDGQVNRSHDDMVAMLASEFRDEANENVNDEDNQRFDEHPLNDQLRTREEDFIEHEHINQDDFSTPIGTKFVEKRYLKPMDESNTPLKKGTNEERHGLSERNGDNCDHLKKYQMSFKADTPPLLAPPKDVSVATYPSETSVNPTIIASFNKIKTRVEQTRVQQKRRRQEEKIMDRRRDIKCYKNLWGEYIEIKNRIVKEREEKKRKTIETPLSDTRGGKISLKDSTSWFVDFSSFKSPHSLDNKAVVDCAGTPPFQEQKNQTHPHLKRSTICYNSSIFPQEDSRKRKALDANSVRNSGIIESPFSKNDHELGTIANFRSDSTIMTMDLDLENRSLVSDLDNGCNTSMTSDIDQAFDNDDYGVLRRYSRKSIESTVPTHTENFNAQLDSTSDVDVPNAFLSDSKRRKQNDSVSSFSTYLEKNCLPSVCIENAETGLIRWRESPRTDKIVKAKRERETECQTNRLQLVRKAGPQINDLIAKLKNNGLG